MRYRNTPRRLNESVLEDKYRHFILAMMGEFGSGKVFTAAISPDEDFCEAPFEEKAFSSFISAREWCERTLKIYDSKYRGSAAYIVMSNIDNFQGNVCLCYDGRTWYFWE